MWPILLGYLAGSLPFAFLLARRAGIDVRVAGSGNVGAANVLRTTGTWRGIAVMALDVAKGSLAVILAWVTHAGVTLTAIAAAAAVVGHVYPVWLRFRGGKGVATFFGIMAALHWPSSLVYAMVWLALLALTRYSSVAGMSAALAAPVAAATFGRFDLAIFYLGIGLLVFWKHRDNLERLLAGTESRVGRRDG